MARDKPSSKKKAPSYKDSRVSFDTVYESSSLNQTSETTLPQTRPESSRNCRRPDETPVPSSKESTNRTSSSAERLKKKLASRYKDSHVSFDTVLGSSSFQTSETTQGPGHCERRAESSSSASNSHRLHDKSPGNPITESSKLSLAGRKRPASGSEAEEEELLSDGSYGFDDGSFGGKDSSDPEIMEPPAVTPRKSPRVKRETRKVSEMKQLGFHIPGHKALKLQSEQSSPADSSVRQIDTILDSINVETCPQSQSSSYDNSFLRQSGTESQGTKSKDAKTSIDPAGVEALLNLPTVKKRGISPVGLGENVSGDHVNDTESGEESEVTLQETGKQTEVENSAASESEGEHSCSFGSIKTSTRLEDDDEQEQGDSYEQFKEKLESGKIPSSVRCSNKPQEVKKVVFWQDEHVNYLLDAYLNPDIQVAIRSGKIKESLVFDGIAKQLEKRFDFKKTPTSVRHKWSELKKQYNHVMKESKMSGISTKDADYIKSTFRYYDKVHYGLTQDLGPIERVHKTPLPGVSKGKEPTPLKRGKARSKSKQEELVLIREQGDKMVGCSEQGVLNDVERNSQIKRIADVMEQKEARKAEKERRKREEQAEKERRKAERRAKRERRKKKKRRRRSSSS